MMKVEVKDNVFTVVTGIKKEDYVYGLVNKEVKDDKGNVVFAFGFGNPQISRLGMICNTVVDDCLAVTIVLEPGTKEEDIKRKYGEGLVVAKKYLEDIEKETAEKKAAIEEVFSEGN